MKGAPNRPFRTIEEKIDPRNVMIHEANRMRGLNDALEVLAPDQKVHVFRVSHSLDVNAGHPSGDGIAPNHGMFDSCPIQGRGYATRSFSHGIHGGDHPFPGEIFQFGTGHVVMAEFAPSFPKPT
jgi:hypothetical protein